MQSLGQKPTDAEIKYIMDNIDVNQNGTIEFEEFLALMSRPDLSPTLCSNRSIASSKGLDNEDDELKRAFKVFDKDGNGKISKAELSAIMKTIGIA